MSMVEELDSLFQFTVRVPRIYVLALEKYRKRKHLTTRAEAFREILREALKKELEEVEKEIEEQLKRSQSQSSSSGSRLFKLFK